MHNALLKYIKIVGEFIKVNFAICDKIRKTFDLRIEDLLRVLLEEEKAAIFVNNSSQYLRGNPRKIPHMAAYSVIYGFVEKVIQKMKKTARPGTEHLPMTQSWERLGAQDPCHG